MREMHAALELAEVLAARNDLLARVTAFLEIDAAEHFEVDHLRNKLFLGCARTRSERRRSPRTTTRRRSRQCELTPVGCAAASCSRGHALSRKRSSHARRAGRRLTRSRCAVDRVQGAAGHRSRHAPGTRRSVAESRVRCSTGSLTSTSDRFGSQHEHRQTLHHRGEESRAAAAVRSLVAIAPLMKGGQQSTLRRAVAVELQASRRSTFATSLVSCDCRKATHRRPRPRIAPSSASVHHRAVAAAPPGPAATRERRRARSA